MNTSQIVILTIGAIVLFWAVGAYNRLIRLRNEITNAFAQIDVQLKRRFDLIPNLVASVERYMEHEKSTLEKITEYRAQAMKSGISDDAKIALDAKISAALGSITVAMEAYPDLKANENVMHLMRSLNEIEEQISAARRAYNQSVTDLNNAIEMFPTNLIAGWMNLSRRAVFEITVAERQNVDVNALFNR